MKLRRVRPVATSLMQSPTRMGLVAIMWALVAVKVIGYGFFHHSALWFGAVIELAFLLLAIALIRSHSRTERINGWGIFGYWLFTLIVSVGRDLS